MDTITSAFLAAVAFHLERLRRQQRERQRRYRQRRAARRNV
jgi:hypothetical protein